MSTDSILISNAPLDFDTLAVLHLDGQLTEMQSTDFSRQLDADPLKVRRLTQIAEFHMRLKEIGQSAESQKRKSTGSITVGSQRASKKSSGRISTRKYRSKNRSTLRSGRRRTSLWKLVVAALILIAVGLGGTAYVILSGQDLLTVTNGSVVVERHGQRSQILWLTQLQNGDRIVTENGEAKIYSRLGDHLVLAKNSAIVWSATNGSMRLDQGLFTADITPRAANSSFMVKTPQADVRVIGTRFTLQADDGLSLLAVDHGRVQLSNHLDQNRVEVAAQQMTATTGKGTLTSTPGNFPSSATEGLTGDYFANQDFTAWRFRRIDPMVDFPIKSCGFDPRVGPECFSVRWRGFIITPVSGTYMLSATVDDGVRLWVDNQLIIDKWLNTDATKMVTNYSATRALKSGQAHLLQLDYFQFNSVAGISLSWSLPGQAKQVIPRDCLRPLHWSAPK